VSPSGLGSWPARASRRRPDAPALHHLDSSMTYRELDERVNRLANGLADIGVRSGDRVAYVGANHPSFFETLFATAILAAVMVPLNTRLADAEVLQQLDDAAATVVIHDEAHAAVVTAAATGEGFRSTLEVGGAGSYDALVARSGDEARPEAATLEDPCLIMYSSGTTGVPKGVVLTQGNLVWNALNVVVDVDLRGDEVALIVTPLFHAAALGMNSLPVLLKGGTLVLAASAGADGMFDLIQHHRVTHLQAVPTVYRSLLQSPRWAEADLSSVRRASSGGSAAPEGLIRAYLERGIQFCQGYGMTEAAPGVMFQPAAMALEKVGSVGVPMFFTDVRLVDAAGRNVAPGSPGEVLVRGPNVMAGYWGRPEATAAAFSADGWYHTGDVAWVDEEGQAFIVDRIKDMYISGGENVYPAEVESVLAMDPNVADCAVIGVPDDRWGEVGHAVVVMVEGAEAEPDEVLARVGERLARFKVPKSVEVVGALPRNAFGKVRKADLRRTYDQAGPANHLPC
jgi:fatty-acyl-CoA synthase